MRDAILIVALVALAGTIFTGILGFLVYPARARKGRHRKKREPSPQQGFARAMFIIFAAATLVTLLFGLMMPS